MSRGAVGDPAWAGEPPGVRTGSRCVAAVGCDGDSGATPADLGAGVRGHTRGTLLPAKHTRTTPGERTAQRFAGPQGCHRGRGCFTPRPLGTAVRARGNWSAAADIRCRHGGSRFAARPGHAGQVGLTRGPRPTSACLVHEAASADPGLRTVVSRLRRTRARGRFGVPFFGGNMGDGVKSRPEPRT